MKKIFFSFLLGLLSFAGFSQCNPNAGLAQETCDQTTQLNADTTGLNITSIIWSSNIPGVTISDTTALNPTVSIANMVPGIYGDSGQVTVWFYLNVTCTTGTGIDSCPVTFFQVPQAYAGPNDSTLGFIYNLQANFSLPANKSQGQWTYIPSLCPVGATVNFDNDTLPTGKVTISTDGYYYFVWNEWNRKNSSCSSSDTISIIFYPCPDLGCKCSYDTSVCGQLFAELYTLYTTPGYWDSNSNISYASYNSIDSINSTYQDSTHTWVYNTTPNDTVTFFWTETSTLCIDTVSIYFANPVPAITNTQDSISCGLTFYNLEAQTPQIGYGYWYDTSPGTYFYDTAFTTSPDSVVVFTDGMHHFYWIVNNGACIDTSDVVPVNFLLKPHANAGGHCWPGLYGPGSEIKTDTACGYDYFLYPQLSVGNGTWHVADINNTWFLNPNSSTSNNPYDTIHTEILTYNTNPSYYDFIWVEDNGYGCTDQDTLRLLFAPIPTGEFTATQPWCIGYPSTIIAHTSYNQIQNEDWGLNNFIWNLDGGIVDTTGGAPVTGLGEDTLYVHWDNGNLSHIVSLLTTNIYGCSSPINFDTVVEPPHINPDYYIEDGTCGLANGIITLYTDTHELTYTWDSTFVAPHDTIQQGLLGDQTFLVLVHGESSSPDAPQGTICTDTLSIYLPDTGYTTAMFDTIIPNGDAPYSASFTNLSINGVNYQWFVYNQNNQLVWSGTDENPAFTINQVSCYHIILVSISNDDCRDTMQWGEFCVYPTGIETGNISNITISPNPSAGILFIESTQTPITEIKITDITGKTVKTITGNSTRLQIDMENQPAGIYFITVKTKENSFVEKIVLENY